MDIASIVLVWLVAPQFPSLFATALAATYDSVFPAIPFAGLMLAIFLARWKDLKEALEEARPGGLRGYTRGLGASLVAASFVAAHTLLQGSLYGQGAAIVLTVYGSSILINPMTARLMLPYATIFALGTTAPAALEWAVGEPLASLSALLASRIVAIGPMDVAWQGTAFVLTSKTGEIVSAVVTPGCSSIISVTTFLGILALVSLDLGKGAASYWRFAAVGAVLLFLLNSVRISLLVWIAYAYGVQALDSVHNWIGYAIFLGFYLIVIARVGRLGKPSLPLGIDR